MFERANHAPTGFANAALLSALAYMLCIGVAIAWAIRW